MHNKILRLAGTALDQFEEWVLFLSVISALLSLFVNVILRYGFHHSWAWSQELVREVIIVTTLLGCSVAVKQGQQVSIDAAVQLLPPLRRPLTVIHHLATFVFAVLLVYYGWKMVQMMILTNQSTIIMHIPLAWLYAVLPVTGILMGIRTLQAMAKTVQSKI